MTHSEENTHPIEIHRTIGDDMVVVRRVARNILDKLEQSVESKAEKDKKNDVTALNAVAELLFKIDQFEKKLEQPSGSDLALMDSHLSETDYALIEVFLTRIRPVPIPVAAE